MKDAAMLKYFLIFSIIFSNYVVRAQDTSSVLLKETKEVHYPGKPLLMSLILPGAGQIHNKSPMWKTATFLGVEIASIVAWHQFTKMAKTLRNENEEFADLNWSLSTWFGFINNEPGKTVHDGRLYTDIDLRAMRDYKGTHHLTLFLSGLLAAEYGEFISSDSLHLVSAYLDSGLVDVVRDRHFYENIGKYDQFLGGWSDANTEWYWEEKKLEDSTEIVIKTPLKDDYLDKRFVTNQMLTMAKYSITTLLFNHVLSGLEAVLTSQKMARDKQRNENIKTDLSLLYNPYNRSGVGGISLTVNF